MNAATKNVEVSVETAAGLERRMTVRLPTSEIEREVAARLAKVGRTAKLKGFRPGKVPAKVVRQYYGGQVRDEVLSELIRASYSRAIAEQKLNPAGGPRIEPLGGPDSEHYSYRATFEVYPEIALQPLADLVVERPRVQVEDPDIDVMLEKLRGQRGKWIAVERAAAAGDRVVVDFAGAVDGKPFQGGEGKEIGIIVGSGQVLADFDRALVGASAGDKKSANVAFPKDYAAANLAGQDAVFEIAVHRVEERELPAIDHEFAVSFGVADGTVEALRADVRKNMERELAERLKNEIKTRVFDGLIRVNRVAVPRSLVEQEIDALQAEALRQMGGKDPKQAPARERFVPLAQRRVTVGLLVQELLARHKIRLDQVRVDARVKELASPYEKPEEAAQFYRSNRGMMAQVEAGVLEDQVVDFLLENVKVNDKTLTFQEFMGT
jgi:trigger factor